MEHRRLKVDRDPWNLIDILPEHPETLSRILDSGAAPIFTTPYIAVVLVAGGPLFLGTRARDDRAFAASKLTTHSVILLCAPHFWVLFTVDQALQALHAGTCQRGLPEILARRLPNIVHIRLVVLMSASTNNKRRRNGAGSDNPPSVGVSGLLVQSLWLAA